MELALAESLPAGSPPAELPPVESALAESARAELALVELPRVESHSAAPATPVERAQAAALPGRCGVKGARLERAPAQPSAPVWFAQEQTRIARTAPVRKMRDRTMLLWQAAARSRRRPSVTTAATATRFSSLPIIAGAPPRAAALTSVAALTALTLTAAERLRARLQRPTARHPMSWRTRTTATRAASSKASALLPPDRKRRRRAPQLAAAAVSRVFIKTAPAPGCARWLSVQATLGPSKPQLADP